MKLRGIYCLGVLLAALCVSGQHTKNGGCPVARHIQRDGSVRFVDCKGQSVSVPTAAPSQTPAPQENQEVTVAKDRAALAYQRYRASYYEDQAQALTYNKGVFSWQRRSTVVIFIVVILLVLSGLVFAGIQFAIAMKPHLHSGQSSGSQSIVPSKIPEKDVLENDSPMSDQSKTDAPQVSTIEASLRGVKITSSVIGLLILVVSIGFFYLYLVYVYPIKDIAQ